MNWWSLRSVGNLHVLKVSYAALLVIPFLTHGWAVTVATDVMGMKVWYLGTLFFGSLFLALANLAYDICCPPVVKRFASPNDLYEKMLAIRAYASHLYPSDNFDASLEHCKDKYNSDSLSKPFWRWCCTLLFLASAVSFAVVFAHRAWQVLDAWLLAG